jgi:hypothetical protein
MLNIPSMSASAGFTSVVGVETEQSAVNLKKHPWLELGTVEPTSRGGSDWIGLVAMR